MKNFGTNVEDKFTTVSKEIAAAAEQQRKEMKDMVAAISKKVEDGVDARARSPAAAASATKTAARAACHAWIAITPSSGLISDASALISGTHQVPSKSLPRVQQGRLQ